MVSVSAIAGELSAQWLSRSVKQRNAEHVQGFEFLARHLDAAAAKAEAMAAGLSAEVFGASPSKGNGHG